MGGNCFILGNFNGAKGSGEGSASTVTPLSFLVQCSPPPIRDKLSVDFYRFLGVRVYLQGGMFGQVLYLHNLSIYHEWRRAHLPDQTVNSTVTSATCT